MRSLRPLGLALIACVGLGFVAFGVDDLTMTAPPPMQERPFERIDGVSPEVLALAAVPIRRGERWAVATAAALVVCGNAGVILGVSRGAGDLPLDVLLTAGLAGYALAGLPADGP